MTTRPATLYMIRNLKTGDYVGPGLRPCKPPGAKIWTKLAHAKSAITYSTSSDYPGRSTKDYIVVEFVMQPTGTEFYRTGKSWETYE